MGRARISSSVASFVMDIAIAGVFVAHVLFAPHTKIEESFNLQAIHDVMVHGVSGRQKWDYVEFPGPVHRSFVGAVLTGYVAFAAAKILAIYGIVQNKVDAQVLVRTLLAMANASSLMVLRRGVQQMWGTRTAQLWVLVTLTQFHLPFWAGRTIPNMWALPLVNLGYMKWITPSRSRTRRGSDRNALHLIQFLGFAAFVFRAEVGILLAFIVMAELFRGRVKLCHVITHGSLTMAIACLISVPLDTYLWAVAERGLRKPIFAELDAFIFNVVHGKSAEWGTEPIYTYITKYIPRLLNLTLPFLGFGLYIDPNKNVAIVGPLAGFIALFSLLGHKEWRFIIYIVPFFNAVSAHGMAWCIERRETCRRYRLAAMLTALVLIASMILTFGRLYISSHNYPGGEAMKVLHKVAHKPQADVHIDTLSLMTGATRFLQLNDGGFIRGLPASSTQFWVYSKQEYTSWNRNDTFTYLLTETPLRPP